MPCAFDTVDLATFIGEVAGVDAVQLPAHLADFELPARFRQAEQIGARGDGGDEVFAGLRGVGF